MKRTLIIILILGIWSTEVKAQVQKGTWMLEGNVGLSRTRSILSDGIEKLDPQSSFSFYPKAGFFIKDNLAIGLSGVFGSTWSKNQDANQDSPFVPLKIKTSRFGGGIFLRKYVNINENLSFFGEIGTDVSKEKLIVKYVDSSENSKRDNGQTFQAQGILGLQYLISSKVGVHLQTNLLQYQKDIIDQGYGFERSEFRAGFLIDPRFGLTIFL